MASASAESPAQLPEILRRGVQICFSSPLFALPRLNRIKLFVLRRFFSIGPKSYISHDVMFESHHGLKNPLKIGSHVVISDKVVIDYTGGIIIEDNVSISAGVRIFTHDHLVQDRNVAIQGSPLTCSPLRIEEGAWIGAASIICPSVRRIGRGAVVGAGCVVYQDVKDYAIMAGNPAIKVAERKETPANTGI